MKALATWFQNDPERPLVYGEADLINPPRQRLRGEPLKEGIPVHPVIVGFCGTDYELMKMGRRGELGPKFPAGQKRQGFEIHLPIPHIPWTAQKAPSSFHSFSCFLGEGGIHISPPQKNGLFKVRLRIPPYTSIIQRAKRRRSHELRYQIQNPQRKERHAPYRL